VHRARLPDYQMKGFSPGRTVETRRAWRFFTTRFTDHGVRPEFQPLLNSQCFVPQQSEQLRFSCFGSRSQRFEMHIVKIEIATVQNAHRTPAEMLVLMQRARVAACCCSTHAWLHARAQHCSGQLQSATAMEQPEPANDSCYPGLRSTAVHPGPAIDGCTPRLRWMPAPRARDGCLHPSPAIDEARARHGRPQPGPAMDSCNPGPQSTAHPGPSIDGCTPRLR